MSAPPDFLALLGAPQLAAVHDCLQRLVLLCIQIRQLGVGSPLQWCTGSTNREGTVCYCLRNDILPGFKT